MINRDQKKIAYRWLMKQAYGSRFWLISKILLLYCSCLLLIFQAELIAHIVDRTIIQHYDLSKSLMLIIILLIVMLSRSFLNWPQEMCGFHTGALVRKKIRHIFLDHFIKIGPIALTAEQSGASASYFLEHIEALQNFYANYLPQLFLAVLIPITLLIVIFPCNWLAGCILLFTAPLIPLFMALIGMGVESANQKHFKSLAMLSAYFLDRLRGLVTLKLFNQSKVQLEQIAVKAEDYRQQTMAVLRIAFLSSGVLELFSSVAIAIVAIILGLSLLHMIHIGYAHTLSLAKALFILLLAPEFYLPLRQLGVHYHARAEAIAASTELLKYFAKADDTIKLTGVVHELIPGPCTIELQNITFGYPNKPLIFNNYQLLIKPQEKIAIMGPSGIGKSTLIYLIMGFIQPKHGAVLINQENLTSLDLESWQRQIAYLGQMPQLFHGTIRENIQIAKTTATLEEVISAAEKAGVMQFVQHFPDGLNTKIAEQNLGLSGGQAQRIALARIFLSDRPIIILDEPTASLDKLTEQQIIAAIKSYLQNKTIILISHRKETTELAERIIYL